MATSHALRQPITGHDAGLPKASALAALSAFYEAFNSRDLDALEKNWAEGVVPVMDNPVGGTRHGWRDIAEGYKRLFYGDARVTVELHDVYEIADTDCCQFIGRETGTCETRDQILDLNIRTSRLFMRIEGRWRQVHHHGSIEQPTLLSAYQSLVLGQPVA
ncbi:YybH family protein [Asticcacaulis solisilvae]|uniref:YybH family protein n=1 Tax=Asticcacaulis solisilvae TaxID=1217274 RepID=UPI003FD81716